MSDTSRIASPSDGTPERRDVAEILDSMEAYFGPHTVIRRAGPFPPVPFVIDHVEPRLSLRGLSGLYLAALAGITAGTLAYAVLS